MLFSKKSSFITGAVALCMVSAFCIASRLGAQEASKLTPNEVATAFASYLKSPGMTNQGFYPGNSYYGVATANTVALGAQGLERLLTQMANEAKSPAYVGKIKDQSATAATVLVSPDDNPPPRPVALVKDDGKWCVDAIETYAKWHHLAQGEKQSRIFDITGVALPGTPNLPQIYTRLCATNLKQTMLGILMYTQDYDQRMPPAKNWQAVIFPYTHSTALFSCPAYGNGKQGGYTYNSALGNKLTDGKNENHMVAIYETQTKAYNSSGSGENIDYRHLEEKDLGANFAFMDGHIKFFSKAQSPKVPLPAGSTH